MPSSLLSLCSSTVFTASLIQMLSVVDSQSHTLPFRDDMSNIASSAYWTDFGSVTQSTENCVGSSPCIQLFGYAELYFLHFSLAEHSTISIGFNLCFDCDSTSTAANAEHFNVYYSCGPSEFVAPNWVVLKQYDGSLPSGTLFEGERLDLPSSCDNAADLNLAFISFTASSSMYIDSLLITTPTLPPSVSPSKTPSGSPSRAPSKSPSLMPSVSPSRSPSDVPSRSPSSSPTVPTAAPTAQTASPSMATDAPSQSPSRSPSGMPSMTPSRSPTAAPTTASPTTVPSTSPSLSPTEIPSVSPTEPTMSPSAATPSPTEVTSSPTEVTRSPSSSPSTATPTHVPTEETRSPITYIEHLRLIADQYNPTATPGPTMAPFTVPLSTESGRTLQSTPSPQSGMTQSPSSPPTSTAVQNHNNGNVNGTHSGLKVNGSSNAITPSPVLVQYVFIRAPTAAPSNGVNGRRGLMASWTVIMGMVMVWTLF